VIHRSELFNCAAARILSLLALVSFLAISACTPNSGSEPPVNNVPFLNLELDASSNANANTYFHNGMFQLYLNRKLEGTPNNWLCVMTLPFADAQNACSTTAGWYDDSSKKGRLYLILNGVEVSLDLDFNELRNVVASLNVDSNTVVKGTARIVATRMEYSSHIDASGAKSLRLNLFNIPPKSSADFDTGDLFVTASSAPSTTTLLGGAHQWSTDYVNVYRNYRLAPVNNGRGQGYMGYVEYVGLLDGSNPDLVAGTYSWVICTLIPPTVAEPNPNCKTTGVTGANVHSAVITDAALDPQAALGVVDSSKLYAFGNLPAAAAAISVSDGAATVYSTLSTNPGLGNATDVAAGPYTITWTSTVQNPTSVDWQVIFTEVDTAGTPISNFAEVRSPRLHHKETNGPVYNSNSGSYTWSLDPDLKIAGTSEVRVVLRVTNSTRTYSADTEAFYLTCSGCP